MERDGDATVRVVVQVPGAEPVTWRGVAAGDVKVDVPLTLDEGTHVIPVRQVYASGATENWRPEVVATAARDDTRDRIVIVLAVAAAVVVADQIVKCLIEAEVGLFSTHEVLPYVSITHVRNTGIAFGIFPGRLEIVSLLTADAVGWILVHFARAGSRHALFPTALGLLVGGSVSNLIDRVRQGYVVDFVDFGYHSNWWPVFNVADSAIVIGVALLALNAFVADADKDQVAAEDASR